jgi:hypothetical protein
LPPYDYALVHMWPRLNTLDRLPGVGALSLISSSGLATTMIVLAAFTPTPVITLRLAEAGCDFVVPYGQVGTEPHVLLKALRGGAVDPRFALPTKWAIRESLGLRWNGAVEPFLAMAAQLPLAVWTTGRPQSAHSIDRKVFRDLQRAARDVAGLPEPHFARYANSVRRPPELPEWARVREFTSALWARPVR